MSDYRQEAEARRSRMTRERRVEWDYPHHQPGDDCSECESAVSGLLDRIAEKDVAIHNLHNDVGTLTSELNQVKDDLAKCQEMNRNMLARMGLLS